MIMKQHVIKVIGEELGSSSQVLDILTRSP